MTMFISGYNEDGTPEFEDDGDFTVSEPVAYANTEPDMYGESASSGDGTIAERAVKTENLAGDVIHTLPDGSKYGQTPDGNYYKITDGTVKIASGGPIGLMGLLHRRG